MLFALLAAFLYAASAMCARQSTALLGPVKANFLRLALASIVMICVTMAYGGVDLQSTAARRLYLSGFIGFGLGDMALFFALPRLGTRLTLLINLCSAPVFGSLGDYWLVGTGIQPAHGIACAFILGGVVLALSSTPSLPAMAPQARLPGVLAALTAGLGQGLGASLSRFAQAAEKASGIPLPSAVETCLRLVPGLLAVGLFWLILHCIKSPVAVHARAGPITPKAVRWIVANATFGAILGVVCFQHALTLASSAVVLSITATTPIVVMPMTFYSEFDQPSLRSIGGATIAVIGVVLLKLLV
ncbi:MAG: family transporter [Verrucomicrobiaceae bacterium]|nr:family transporter [Verrucomicrobiaceae bacterium]